MLHYRRCQLLQADAKKRQTDAFKLKLSIFRSTGKNCLILRSVLVLDLVQIWETVRVAKNLRLGSLHRAFLTDQKSMRDHSLADVKVQNEDDSLPVPHQYRITKKSSSNDRTTKVIVTKQNRKKLRKVAEILDW
jgi:hypothetical protein